MSLYSTIQQSVRDGFTNVLGKSIGSPAANAVLSQAVKYIPPAHIIKANRAYDAITGTASMIQSGNWEGIVSALLSGGGLDGLVTNATQMLYWNTPNPLLGGISPAEAKKIYDEVHKAGHARKNLFLLHIESALDRYCPPDRHLSSFNLFATDIEYSPFIISGEKIKIGGAVVDKVEGCEAVEMSITTLDDENGTLKRWFSEHHAATVHSDGTVGVPAEYEVKIDVLHAFITDESNRGGYNAKGYFRPSNLQTTLSRRDNALEEIQMTFSQLDTFRIPT